MNRHLIKIPQLVTENAMADCTLNNKTKLSLYKKSTQSGIATNILEEVYRRGLKTWNESFNKTPEQFAFDRVNSFVAGGFAAKLDSDLLADQVNNTKLNETKVQLVKRVVNEATHKDSCTCNKCMKLKLKEQK